MKAVLFHKFKSICIKTILWTRTTNCFTIFVHVCTTFGEMAIQSCEDHLVLHGHVKEGPSTYIHSTEISCYAMKKRPYFVHVGSLCL